MPVTKAYVIQLFIGTLYTLALAGMLIAALVSIARRVMLDSRHFTAIRAQGLNQPYNLDRAPDAP